jgi:hypothetical protein
MCNNPKTREWKHRYSIKFWEFVEKYLDVICIVVVGIVMYILLGSSVVR